MSIGFGHRAHWPQVGLSWSFGIIVGTEKKKKKTVEFWQSYGLISFFLAKCTTHMLYILKIFSFGPYLEVEYIDRI